jgi:hypothetical protein
MMVAAAAMLCRSLAEPLVVAFHRAIHSFSAENVEKGPDGGFRSGKIPSVPIA